MTQGVNNQAQGGCAVSINRHIFIQIIQQLKKISP